MPPLHCLEVNQVLVSVYLTFKLRLEAFTLDENLLMPSLFVDFFFFKNLIVIFYFRWTIGNSLQIQLLLKLRLRTNILFYLSSNSFIFSIIKLTKAVFFLKYKLT